VIAVSIEPATEDDKAWIMALWKANTAYLGRHGEMQWFRYWSGSAPNAHWDVLREQGFVHWRQRRDGWRTVYDICTAEPGRGVGRQLMEHVGRPVRLKTLAENTNAQEFYRHLGMVLSGRHRAHDGTQFVEMVGL
jgi:GNAT superfamily N-acetyltransferase